MLSLDPFNLVCIIVNLIVLYILMKKFVFGRVLNVIEARQQMINEEKAGAKAVREEADRLKKEYEENLRQADETSNRIVQEARNRAQGEYSRILDRAAADAEAMKASAQKSIAMEREKTMDELHAQIMDLAVEAAGKIMSEKAGPENDSILYDAFIKEAGDVDGAKDE
ncbi:MAG: F0F1 ATP synthase subunit B [Lachnospiraceae bacterium]|nr:F0F1 ATP synthase subunit B [Lachnospiraceae bacterium]